MHLVWAEDTEETLLAENNRSARGKIGLAFHFVKKKIGYKLVF